MNLSVSRILGCKLHAISDIFFAYFNQNSSSGGYRNEDTININGHPSKGIKIHIGIREPHTKLRGRDEGLL